MATRKANEVLAANSSSRLEIARVFDAPRDLVFEMWSKPEHLGKWSAPNGFTIPDARSDFREGGRYYAHMRSPLGEDHRIEGKYLEIVPGKCIVMTHAWLDESGTPGAETRITVTFESRGKQTRMTFVQEGFASKASRDGHAGGWNECFDLLKAHLATIAERARR